MLNCQANEKWMLTAKKKKKTLKTIFFLEKWIQVDCLTQNK